MNSFFNPILTRHKLKLLFVLVWLHVSLLDLFYITYQGPVFLWHENMQLLTVTVHFSIALFTTLFYWLMSQLSTRYCQKSQ